MTENNHTEHDTPAVEEQGVTCPNCGTVNAPQYLFCVTCGTMIKEEALPAFLSVDEEPEAPSKPEVEELEVIADELSEEVAKPETEELEAIADELPEEAAEPEVEAFEEVVVIDEPPSAFAEGLPPWDVVPPEIMVRRH
ncbi:MAG: zinc ribbon domain-containing protein [Clostridia bacterium]|nr:zinc ribbon domain-containing protein [Clostridia bacterium]